MSATFATAGEALVGRALEKETRAGVEHFKPGQHEAVIYTGVEYGTDRPSEIGRITYVDQMGQACCVLAYRYTDDGSDWFPTWVGRAGQTWKEDARRAPEGFTLSAKMLAALAVAPYGRGDSRSSVSGEGTNG